MANDETPGMTPRRASEVPHDGAEEAPTVGSARASADSADRPDAEYLLPEQQDTAQDVKTRRKRNRVALGVTAGILGFVLLAVAVIVGFYVKSANDAMNHMQRQPLLPQGERPRPPPPRTASKPPSTS